MTPIKLIAVIMLVSLMLQCGLQVDRARIVAVLKDYALLGRALLANVILVPLFAAVLVRAFHLSDAIAAGILLMAIAPGVPFLPNAAGKRAGGSLDFALALCFVMPAISIVSAPLTARVVFPPLAQAAMPVTSLIVTLTVFQLLPLVIGLLISDRAPRPAAKLVRPLAVVVAICIIAVLLMLAPAVAKAVATVYGTYGLLTALLVILFSLGSGWLLGGPQAPYRNTLALATVLRNIGLALLIATLNFPETAAAAMVIGYFLVQVVVSTIAGRLFARSSRRRLTNAPGGA